MKLAKYYYFFIVIMTMSLSACDPDGRKKCQWVLEPDPTLLHRVDDGYVPVCARNRETMKQDCRLQTTLEFAKSTSGKTFRYVDMEIEKAGKVKKITKIEYCTK